MTHATENAGTRIAPPVGVALAIAAACFALGGLIALINLSTPPWMDEFNTYATTMHGHSLGTFFEYSLRGQHPLGFEFPVYLAQAAGVTELTTLRLYNLTGVALTLGATWIAYRRGALSAAQAAVIVALYVSSTNFLSYFGSLRPYFLMFSSSIAAALAWRLVQREGWRKARWFWFGALAIFANIHYFATIFGGLMTAVLLLQRLAEKDMRGALWLGGLSALAASPAIILGALQSTSTIESGTLYYYTPGLGAGMLAIGAAMSAAIALNVPAGLAGLWGAYKAIRTRSEIAMLVLFGAALFFFAAMIAVHLYKPLLYDRYLMAAAGAILVPTAVMAAGPAVHRFIPALICGYALLAQGYFLFFAPRVVGWEQSAAMVEKLVRECPDAKVYSVPYARVSNGPIWTTPLNPTEIEARRFGYRYYATRHNFTTQDLSPGATVSPSGECPSLIWIEHFWPDTPARLLYNLAIQNNGQGYYSQVGSGVVIVVQPKPAPKAD